MNIDYIKKSPLCSSLSESKIKILSEFSTYKKTKRGEYLWRIGDPGDYAVIIKSGVFLLSKFIKPDHEIYLGIFSQGDLMGLPAIYLRSNYIYNCRSLTNGGEVIKLNFKALFRNQQNNLKQLGSDELAIWVRDHLLTHEQILKQKIDFLSAGNTEEKIYELLKQLNFRFGKLKSKDEYIIPINITRNLIAKLIDARVETVIRIISNWQKNELITWNLKTGINLKLTSLEKFIQLSKNKIH